MLIEKIDFLKNLCENFTKKSANVMLTESDGHKKKQKSTYYKSSPNKRIVVSRRFRNFLWIHVFFRDKRNIWETRLVGIVLNVQGRSKRKTRP